VPVPSAELTATLRASLEEERGQLQAQLAELDDDSDLSYDENFADSAQVAGQQGANRALAGQLKENLSEVERALQKMEAGTYGICERCGKEIAEARLEAMPATPFCIDDAGR
jgi:RNA polymerase-binding transcription factor DksA